MREGLIKTDNVLRLLGAVAELKRAHQAASGRSLAVVEGLTGRGKTTATEWYVVQDADCAYLEADPDWTPSWLLRDVAEALGLTRAHALETNKLAVVEEQKRRPRLLVIDEADRVVRRSALLETVRGLHDKARLPIVLVGEAGIWQAIFRKSPRTADRVSQVVPFRDVSAKDIEQTALELCDLRLPPERAAQIQKTAQGNFRRAAKILGELEKVLKVNPGEVSPAKVELALQNLQMAEARESRKRAAAGGS
ncbi:MAG: AAA family ATPase [Deltaproteobacteria bacterium]|nr:AAA family ATPase [Deltaproteobacteria bacterium]